MRIRKNLQKNESDFGIFCTLLKKPDVSPEKKQFSTNLVDILQEKSLNNWKPNVLGKRSEYDISHDHNVPAVKCKTRLKTHSYKLRTVFKTTR